MSATRANTRTVQVVLLALLVVCAAQVAWWILDQWLYMEELAALVDEVPGLAEVIDHDRRMNRYLWEGGFFLVVLLAGMGILARAVRQETRLRYRQQVFLAAVSHELRSPLATARAAAETLELRHPPPGERERLLGRVLRNLRRLERMVDNLLDTARIDEGQLVLRPEPVVVAEALAPVLAAYRDRAAERRVDLSIEIDPALIVRADPEVLRTVIRNLVDNAHQSVEGTDGAGRVVLHARGEGEHVLLVVEDDGHGFLAADREQIFERFWRPGDEMRRGGRGAGLGLYIARALARASGADLAGSSPGLGRGARFEVRWPAS